MRIDFARTAYQSRAIPSNAQRMVNCYAEAGEGKDPLLIYGTPGFKSFATISEANARGAVVMNGTLYVVYGSGLYSVTSGGTVAQISGVSIDGSGRVSMDTNGTQIAIATDQDTGYVATTSTLAEIADADFPGAQSVAFLDGYMIYVRPDTDVFFLSNLNAASVIDSTDFATAEAEADNLNQVVVASRNVWLFGTDTTEVWFNAGQSGFPLARRASLDRGSLGKFAGVAQDNTVLWMGEDRIAYRNEGYLPRRISNHGIEEELRKLTTVSDVEAWTYTQAGHKFVGWTFPTEGRCFVYDAATGLWHERESDGLTRWRAGFVIEAYGKVLAGDYQGTGLYELDLDTYTEAGGTLRSLMASPPLAADYHRGTIHTFALDIEGGVGLSTGQGSDPQAMLRYSKDGGKTWSNELWRSFGQIGEYRKRAKWNRLGQFNHPGIVFEVSISDPVKRAVMGVYVEAEGNAL